MKTELPKKKKPKPRNVDVTMIKLPGYLPGYDGLDVYAEMDGKILGGRKSFTSKVPVRGRSLPQNSIWAIWYTIIGKETGQTPEAVKRECKLLYGVPLYCAQDTGFCAMWQDRFENLDYNKKLFGMRFITVTSELSKMNGSRYTETLQQEYAKQKIILNVI